jgi:carboxymethylenebutenolidase
MGQTIEVDAPAGPAEAYLTGAAGTPGVLFHIDVIGLRPRIEEMADRIAGWGYTVLAPNAFYRLGRAADLRPTADLRIEENRTAFFRTAGSRSGELTPDLSDADATAWVEALAEHAPGPIGVTGYCMGARLAVRTACLHPEVVAACGGFHGGGLASDDESSPHRLLGRARAEFVFGHADHDQSMPPEQIVRLGKALAAAGLTATNEVYAGAAHGYTMADGARYEEAATERHFAALESLFARTLGR